MAKKEDKKIETVQEEVEVVELFDENGQSLVFELLSTIEDEGKKYFILTPFIENESQIDPEIPAEVFVMQQVTKENDEKMLEPVADTSLVEKIFNKFKRETTGKYDFADTDSVTEKQKSAQEIDNYVVKNDNALSSLPPTTTPIPPDEDDDCMDNSDNTDDLYIAYERLHSVMDSNQEPKPTVDDFDGAVKNFLLHTGSNPTMLEEYYLLMSCLEYLYYEAPDDEQNLFMVIELIDAGIVSEIGEESDLDRLFEMLRKKDEKHIALCHYEKFKSIAGEKANDIFDSCRRHFSAIGCKRNIFRYIIDEDRDIEILAKIIIKTFAENKHNSDELYNYLITLYYDSQKNRKPVKDSDININIEQYGIDKLIEFYAACYDDSGDNDDDDDNLKSVKKQKKITYEDNLDYLMQDEEILREEIKEIMAEADIIISNTDSKKEKLIEAYLKKVQCLQKLDNYSDSEDYVKKLLDLSPNMPEALVRLGNVYAVNYEHDKAIELYNKVINSKKGKEYAYAYNVRGLEYAENGEYDKAIDDYNIAIRYKPDFALAFYNRGRAYNSKKEYKKAAKDFIKTEADILWALYYFGENVVNFMLDDYKFFKEATQECKTEKLMDYKDAYIQSLKIILELRVNKITDEMPVAHYTYKDVSEKMLFENSAFRLNPVTTSNDTEEGKTLHYYLFPQEIISAQVENGAFAGCFAFDNDKLNQFRLYGKANAEEGTGVSIAFKKDFFSTEISISNNANIDSTSKKTQEEEELIEISGQYSYIQKTVPLARQNDTENIREMIKTDTEGEKIINKGNKYSPLYRCIYIDTDTSEVISLGQKEKCTFYRDKKSEEEFREYQTEIDDTLKEVEKRLKKLKKQIKDWKLNPTVMYRLLLNLRYLIKNAAFKEEQECRIIQIKKLTDEKVIEENNRFYVEYEKLSSDNVDKIVFAPNVKDIEKYKLRLAREGYNEVECYQSKAPLAKNQ